MISGETPYQYGVLADNPLFYLIGDSPTDEVVGLPMQFLNGVQAGGSSIAPGLTKSFVWPVINDADATPTGILTPADSAVALRGFPGMEAWVAMDHFSHYAPTGAWVQVLEGAAGPIWVGLYPSTSTANFEYVDSYEVGIGNNPQDFNEGSRDWAGPPFVLGRPVHLVAYYGSDFLPHLVVNGTSLPDSAEYSWSLSNHNNNAPISTPNTPLRFGHGTYAPNLGHDRWPGRMSDMAVYANCDKRDMVALARRHYAAGMMPLIDALDIVPGVSLQRGQGPLNGLGVGHDLRVPIDASGFGVDGSGIPYFDTAGSSSGEAGQLVLLGGTPGVEVDG